MSSFRRRGGRILSRGTEVESVWAGGDGDYRSIEGSPTATTGHHDSTSVVSTHPTRTGVGESPVGGGVVTEAVVPDVANLRSPPQSC